MNRRMAWIRKGIREFRDYLKVLASEGVGILISSHLLSEMQLMCDSFAVIEKGKLIHTKEHIVDEKPKPSMKCPSPSVMGS